MDLSWSTFVLEVINFLVLVWILNHFLYKPVMNVIARRRDNIEQQMQNAEQRYAQAEQLQQQYQNRAADWEQEKNRARTSLAAELEAERTRKTAEIDAVLQQRQEHVRVAEQRRQQDLIREAEEKALELGAGFAARLLRQAAGPELEARLLEMMVAEMSLLPDERVSTLRAQFDESTVQVQVNSAYPLTEQQRDKLQQSLARFTPTNTQIEFKQQPELVAGLQVLLGAWELGFNLRDELKGFADLADEQ